MLKIPKGLKKKKKGKKGKKGKEDELFDPEELAELERYRKEKQQKEAEAAADKGGPSEASESAQPPDEEDKEEWEKFKALTSGVDNVLKKTQEELDRIKTTSYYQKKPPGPSVPEPIVKPAAVPGVAPPRPPKGKWVGFEEGASEEPEDEVEGVKVEVTSAEGDPFEAEKVEEELEEEESEFEDDADDLFDTSYVDVVASGEVKLAYVPDSPDLEDEGPDPFDTSIVDKVIKFDPQEEKRKKLVSLGCAVEVLTGKLEKPVEVPPEIVKHKRRRPRPQDLLLGSFDEGPALVVEDAEPEPAPKSILDDDPVFAEETSEILGLPPVTPIAEVKPISSPLPVAKPRVSPPKESGIDLKTLVEEFVDFGSSAVDDTLIPPVSVGLNQEPDELDDEFAALAAESLHRTETVKPPKPPPPSVPPQPLTADALSDDEFNVADADDPFDTTFATQVLPGKFELKLIEKEILHDNVAVVGTSPALKIQEVLKKSELSAKVVNFESEAELKAKNDLLSGSASDLSHLGHSPLAPRSLEDIENDFAGDDPFDTSVVEKIVAPGKTELKFLEKELLSGPPVPPIPSIPVLDDDDDFDPRAEEKPESVSRPDNLLVTGKRVSVPKVVAFNVQTPGQPDLLGVDQEENSKVSKPLTPYYPPAQINSAGSVTADPFDTSYVGEASKPGKLELQILEQELAAAPAEIKRRLSDDDFDPRGSEEEPANPSNGSAGFNPFLSGAMDDAPADNPFMSAYSAPQDHNAFDSIGGGSNPFAFGGADEGSNNIFGVESIDQSADFNYENIFASQPTSGMDIFGSSGVPSETKPQENIFTTATTEEQFMFSPPQEQPVSGTVTPKRPPPPRPGPPKETKDLILSVTGAMEATSSDLLDRLQATRTPSPTPMRDLASPSPTHFGDLLDVDGPAAPPPTAVPQEANLLGDDFDFSAPVVAPLAEKSIPPEPTMSPPQAIESFADMTSPIQPNYSVPPSIPSVPHIPPQPVAPVAPYSVPPAVSPAPVVNVAPHGPPPKPPAPTVAPAPAPAIPPGRPAPPSIPERPKLPPQPTRPPAPVLPPRPTTPEVKVEPVTTESSFGEVFGGTNNTSADFSTTEVFSQPAPISEASATQPHTDLFSTDLSDDVFSAAGQEGGSPFTDSADASVFPSESTTPFPTSTAPPSDDFALNFNIAPTAAAPPKPPPPAVPPHPQQSYNMFDEAASQPPVPVESSPFSPPTSAVEPSPFSQTASTPQPSPFAQTAPPSHQPFGQPPAHGQPDEFDAFAAKFESVGAPDKSGDPFGDSSGGIVAPASDPFDPFASSLGSAIAGDDAGGFGADDNFDSFLSLREPPPVPQGTPAHFSRAESAESEDNDFNIFIKPKQPGDESAMVDNGPVPSLAPPPKSPSQANAFQDGSPRLNPFDISQEPANAAVAGNVFSQVPGNQMARTDSQETPPTPLFDEDVSQPLEDFPRLHYTGPGWEMMLRQPNKKKITGQRFWKKIFVKLVNQEAPTLQLYNSKDDKDPFQELPLQPCYSVSDIGAQQFDQYGKIFTVKLQFVFYKERPGVRPGQVTKAERITNKLSQFAAYAIQGDYQGVKEFGSDLKKLGLPVEHAPQISQLFKIGCQSYEDMKQFSMCIEESLFRLSAHRDRALNYKMEEVQITAVDELYVEQNAVGIVEKQIARVRLFFLGFLSGMPDVELGVNDIVRQGKEVVGRHDIIPVATEEWIRLEAVEFHSCIQLDNYEQNKTIKFKPPDAMYIELMRFRVRPPRNRELPLQLKCTMCVTGNKVEIHGDILVPGFTSRKLGQIPCEDVSVRIPIPECWIYQFRVEKHFRYGSVKSAHRRTGKVKGIERFLGAMENMEPSLMEVTSGQAKYEHQHRAIVWRMPRLPKEGQGAYTTHNLVVRLQLTSYDQIPDELAKYAYVEFTMPATTVSHTTVRSVSIQDSDSDSPPEKYVRHLARCEYRVEIEHTQGEGPDAYIAATAISKPAPIVEEKEKPHVPPPVSDSDSDSG